MGIYLPYPGNVAVQEFIAANAPNPTGAIADDFRSALVAALGVTEPPYLSTDDLWKLYLETNNAPFIGMHAGAYGPDFVLGGASGAAVRDVAVTVEPINEATELAITLPTREAGDLLVVIHNTASTALASTPSGWTLLAQSATTGAVSIFGRLATGDANDDVTLVLASGNSRMVATAYSIQDWHGTVATGVEASVVAGIDPPNLEPAWGEAENVWLTGMTTRKTDMTFTAPTDYTDRTDGFSNGSSTSLGTCSQSSARRVLEATADDPDTWVLPTGTGANSAKAWTLAVRPA